MLGNDAANTLSSALSAKQRGKCRTQSIIPIILYHMCTLGSKMRVFFYFFIFIIWKEENKDPGSTTGECSVCVVVISLINNSLYLLELCEGKAPH